MKKNVIDFIRRGLIACGFGPIILAIIYLILQKQGIIQTLSVNEVCDGILSIALLAFIVGGTYVVYQIERLPLSVAILIHGSVLYVTYLAVYLLNGWLKRGITPILVFTGIFLLGYLLIWSIIWTVTKNKTDKLNKMLKEKQ